MLTLVELQLGTVVIFLGQTKCYSGWESDVVILNRHERNCFSITWMLYFLNLYFTTYLSWPD